MKKTELNRLVEKHFDPFGINKKREIERLLFEISKRDKSGYLTILSRLPQNNSPYAAIKKALLKLRFPYSACQKDDLRPYLPKLDIDPVNTVKTCNKFCPSNIYIEKTAYSGSLAGRIRDNFPKAKVKRIGSLKNLLKEQRAFSIRDYNNRLENLYVTEERHDFFKKCPCTKSAISCGYYILNIGFGCVYECSYCFLQEYTNCPGIILPSNINAFLDRLKSFKKPGMRIGTGEFTDSLALDHITQYSLELVGFFDQNRDITLELKTKSCNVSNLLNIKHGKNVVIAWSINPENIILKNEFNSASLGERIEAALKCIRAGYRVAIHLDPIIYHKNWQKEYRDLVNRLFDAIHYRHIAWISRGTLRFNPHLKTIIENRFPDNRILDEELLIGFDNKLRYPDKQRYIIYKNMLSLIRKRSKKTWVYLCMENIDMWKALKT